jgi:hypothetical protein
VVVKLFVVLKVVFSKLDHMVFFLILTSDLLRDHSSLSLSLFFLFFFFFFFYFPSLWMSNKLLELLEKVRNFLT